MNDDLTADKLDLEFLAELYYFYDEISDPHKLREGLKKVLGDNYILKVRTSFYSICKENFISGWYNEGVFRLAIISNNDILYKYLCSKCHQPQIEGYISSFGYNNLDLKNIEVFTKNRIANLFLIKLDLIDLIKSQIEADNLYASKNYKTYTVDSDPIIKKYKSLYNFKFIVYSNTHTVNFGKLKGRNIHEILEIQPSLIVFYVKNLKHFVLSKEAIINPFLIDYMKENYFRFMSLCLIKLDIVENIECMEFNIDEVDKIADMKSESDFKELSNHGYDVLYENICSHYDDSKDY